MKFKKEENLYRHDGTLRPPEELKEMEDFHKNLDENSFMDRNELYYKKFHPDLYELFGMGDD